MAPSIGSLGKRTGERCRHLTSDLQCAIYEDRPDVCRQYQADEICLMIEAPTLPMRVQNYLDMFGLTAEIPVDKQGKHVYSESISDA